MSVLKPEIEAIKTLLTSELGVDFSAYKDSTVSRRIARRMQVLHLKTEKEYLNYLRTETKELKILGQDIFINVTEFFRDKQVFEHLKRGVLPEIFRNKKPEYSVKFWIVGCATGEEVYSVAILIYEYFQENNFACGFKIIATDIQEKAINVARKGIYKRRSFEKMPAGYQKKYFDEEKDGYRVKKFIRTKIIFAVHDITKDPPFAKADFVSCRNLLIYLDKKNQLMVLNRLAFALNIGGFLLLGKSESLIELSDELKSINNTHKTYQKIKKTRVRRLIRTGLSYDDAYYPIEISNDDTRTMKNNGLSKFLQETIYGQYTPAIIVIDGQFFVKYITKQAKEYIDTPEDYTSTYNLIKFAPKQIVAVVRSALVDIQNKPGSYIYRRITIGKKKKRTLSVKVEPLKIGEDVLYTIVLEKEEDEVGEINKKLPSEINLALEQQLAITENNLQKSIEQLEGANQEMMASNEELQSTNEEYVSVNEELQTINTEYQETIFELSQANRDIDHLMQSTDIGTLFLDGKLNIRKFTTAVKKLVNIDNIDIGRPLKNFTTNLRDINISKEAKKALETGKSLEREAQDNDGLWFLMRISSYDIDDDSGKGLVISFIDINHLKIIEQALSERELLYRTMFEHSSDGIIIVNARERRVVSANERMLKMMGYTLDEFLNMSFMERFPEVQPGGERTMDMLQRFLMEKKDKKYSYHEMTQKRKDGTLIDVEVNAVQLSVPYEGHLLATIRDISDRKEADRKLLAAKKRFETVFETSALGISIADVQFNIIRTNKAFARMIGYTTKQLGQMAFGDITHHEDRKHNIKFIEALNTGKKKTIVFEKRYVKKSGAIFWARLWVSLLDDGSGDKLYLATIRDITKEKKAAQDLRASEAMYRHLFNHAFDGLEIYEYTDFEKRTTSFIQRNSKFRKLLGRTNKELNENGVDMLTFSPELQANGLKSKEYLAKIEFEWHGKTEAYFEWRFLHKKGYPVDVMISMYKTNVEDKKVLIGIYKDITKQKKDEQIIKDNERRYRALFEKSMDAILIYDIHNNKTLSVNEEVGKLFDCSREHVLKHSPMLFFPKFQGNEELTSVFFGRQIQQVMEKGEHRHFMKMVSTKGKLLETEVTTFLLYETPDSPVVVMIRDMTKEKMAQKALEESETRFRNLFEHAVDGLMVGVFPNSISTVNEKMVEIFGYSREEFQKISTLDLCPERQADGRTTLEHMGEHKEKIVENRCCFSGDWLFKRKDGSVFYSELTLSQLSKENENTLVVHVRDITERKKSEQALEHLNSILAKTKDAVSMADMTGKFVYMNEAGKKMFRIPEDVVLQDIIMSKLQPKEAQENFRKHIMPAIKKTGFWSGEGLRYTADGHSFLASFNAIGHFSADGELEYISSIGRDITEQRKKEIALQSITTNIAKAYSDDFFIQLVESIAKSLDVLCTTINIPTDKPNQQEILAMYYDGKIITGELRETGALPCRYVYEEGEQIFVCDLQKDFPGSEKILHPDVESYAGLPIKDSKGNIIAHICVFDTKPIGDPDFIMGTLKIYATRIGAELERAAREKTLKDQKDYLRESETRFRAVFDNSYNLICILDKTGKLLQHNAGNREFKEHENIGKLVWNVYRFSHDEKVATQIRKDIQKVIKGKEVKNECTYRKKGDNIGYLAYSMKPIYLENGEFLFILVEARDITELMSSQTILSNKVDELNDKNNELKKYIESNLALENFAYIASHDLREPLRTITSFANIIQRKYIGKLDKNAKEYLHFIVSSAKSMDILIKDLLTFSKVNSDGTPYAEVPLLGLLERLLLTLGQNISETNTTIELLEIPKTVWANNTQITQLFQNLISNAIKFRKPNIQPEILIKGKSKKTHWEFMVKDNGIGINESFHDKIFMLFKRLHGGEEYEGTGIGLALCKSIVSRHGGEMWLESKEGKGTTFYFTLAKR